MAHEIATMVDGRSAMAYVGDERPWHGLGQQLEVGASIETWAEQAGLNFTIAGSPVLYQTPQGLEAQGSKQVLYRTDTNIPLGVVGNKYQVVQPIEILEFFRDLVAEQGFQLETAGVLFGGSKVWALARTGQEAKIGENDILKDYLLLATACDGTLKTTAKRTSIRTVCNNTLNIGLKESGGSIKVAHSTTFDAASVKQDLGLRPADFDIFADQMRLLADTKLTDPQAIAFVRGLFADTSEKGNTQTGRVLQLYSGQGKGSGYATAKGTAWGILNALTENQDWHQGKNQDRRLEASWLYGGLTLKQTAMDRLLAFANTNDEQALLVA
jgi:phage/plasmid-like protein (TIGR03299 family)